jgi:23S rRNA (adenine2503-C2)-methyltransferase
MPVFLNGLTSAEIHEALADAGATPGMARRIQRLALRDAKFPEHGKGIPSALLKRLSAEAAIPRLEVVDKVVSPSDGFTKYLFRSDGSQPFEAVRIPLLHRADDPKYVVCISSQVGCSLGCAFCATAKLGLRRNLAAWEMVDQVVQVQADSQHPVRGVVFMGMGEPMMNYEAVIRAAKICSEPSGLAIAAKAISISTAGIIPGIRRFTAEGHGFRLVVSLTSADPVVRRKLMPVEAACPTPRLMEALRDYHAATGRRVILAWVMIAGVNTREEDARQLAGLVKDLPIRLDLIDVNDPTGAFQRPSDEERNAFRDALRRYLAQPVARRYSGGQDILAGCGMLAGGA